MRPADGDRPAKGKRIALGDKTIEYHGGLLLSGYLSDKRFFRFVVGFTYGRFESIRLLEEYPEENRVLLV